jgi:hypothetical protein
MSHQEKIERLNAQLNTTDTWAQRWQIEREHNERLLKQASQARTGVHQLRAAAIERYANNQRNAAAARTAEDPRKADVYDRMSIVQSGMVRALDDVLQLFDQIEHMD